MCEPFHSVTQWPTQDQDGNPTESRVEQLVQNPKAPEKTSLWPGGAVLETRTILETATKTVWDWFKKIGSWLHLSVMGKGHSESAEHRIPLAARAYLPLDTKYEVQWWNRNVRLNGSYNGFDFDKQEALDCATLYANKVSIGNMHLLRKFLETSMRHSPYPFRYLEAFYQMLKGGGKDVLSKKIKDLFGGKPKHFQLESVIKVMLGITRKREFLVQEWDVDMVT